MTASTTDSGPLPIPEDWKYGVVREPYSMWETHVLTDPAGHQHRINVNSLDFWSDPQDFLSGIRDWVVRTTGGRDTHCLPD